LRELIDPINAALANAIKSVEKQFKVTIRFGRVTYMDDRFTSKMTVSKQTEDGKAIDSEAADFKRFAARYGLKATDLGRRFKNYQGVEYMIMGLATRNRKFPILCIRTDNLERFKLPARLVIQRLPKLKEAVTDNVTSIFTNSEDS